MGNVTQSRLDSGLGFQAKVSKSFFLAFRCRGATTRNTRQSRSDFGLGFQAQILKPLEVVPSSLGSGVRERVDLVRAVSHLKHARPRVRGRQRRVLAKPAARASRQWPSLSFASLSLLSLVIFVNDASGFRVQGLKFRV